jgi:hypothetical protein
MPPLDNPRWEAFAQAIVKGLAEDKPNGKNTAKAAYLAAGYSPTTDRAAITAASRLLTNVDLVVERVRELQAEALARIQPKLDISRERVGRRLDRASQIAESKLDAASMVSSELGLAKVFGLAKADDSYNPTDPDSAKSMTDIGRLLLESVGASSPSQAAISLAIEANNAFIERLDRLQLKTRADSVLRQLTLISFEQFRLTAFLPLSASRSFPAQFIPRSFPRDART